MTASRRAAAPRPLRRQAQAGFTLIEIMVVVFIMGILISMASLSMGNRSAEERMDVEARRMQRVLELAIEEAELKGVDLGLRLTAEELQVLALDQERNWVQYAEAGPLRTREIPPPFSLQLFVEGRAVPPAVDETDKDKKLEPQVMLLSSGEVTAFSLDLKAAGMKAYYRLDADALGKLKLEHKEPT